MTTNKYIILCTGVNHKQRGCGESKLVGVEASRNIIIRHHPSQPSVLGISYNLPHIHAITTTTAGN
jgi:hypothetical protein